MVLSINTLLSAEMHCCNTKGINYMKQKSFVYRVSNISLPCIVTYLLPFEILEWDPPMNFLKPYSMYQVR